MQLHVEGHLSAKHACLISYWAAKAGAKGPVKDLAFRPNASTGHYQRHLDAVAGLRGRAGDFLSISVPGHTKHSDARTVMQVKVYPPHERLHLELAEDPDIAAKARATEWPPSVANHPVMRQSQGAAIPLAFYLDV